MPLEQDGGNKSVNQSLTDLVARGSASDIDWRAPCSVALGQLRLLCGKPSYNDLSRLSARLRRSTIGDVLSGRSRPSLAFVIQFVRVCSEWARRNHVSINPGTVDEQRWVELWRRDQAPSASFPISQAAPAHGPDTDRRPEHHPSDSSPATGSTRTPRQLPGRPGGIVGRDHELAVLDELTALGADHHEPVIVTGMGGVGKTALVLTWAHKCRSAFPDGDLWIDLQGFSPHSSIAPLQALTSLLRTLGISPREMSEDVEHMSALFRSIVADRRMLLVLDNAYCSEQVLPLIPGTATCTTILTSRVRLRSVGVRYGARRMAVLPLSRQDGVALLRDSAQRAGVSILDVEHASELSQWCGDLPLALRVVAEQLAYMPAPHVLESLRDVGHRRSMLNVAESNSGLCVESALAWSFDRLPVETYRVLRLMTYHPGSLMSLGAVAALCDLHPAQTREHIYVLMASNLLEAADGDRHRMHDLVRWFARPPHTTSSGLRDTVAPLVDEVGLSIADEDGRSAVQRLVTWCFLNTRNAIQLLYPRLDGMGPTPDPIASSPHIPASPDEALNWLNAELDTIIACIESAYALGDFQVAVWLTCCTWRFLPGQTLSALHEKALLAAESTGDLEAQCRLLTTQSAALGEAGQHAHAREYARRAVALNLARGRNDLASTDLCNVGFSFLYQKDVPASMAAFAEALDLATAAEYARGQAHAEQGLAEAHLYNGDFVSAVENAAAAAQRARSCGSPDHEADAWRTLAEAERALGHDDEAIQAASQALSIDESVNNKRGALMDLKLLEDLSRRSGQAYRADEFRQRAKALQLP